MKRKTGLYLLTMIPFVVIAFMYELIPLVMVGIHSFFSDKTGEFSLENYQTVFSKLLYQKAISNSVKISLISAVVGICIAIMGARAIEEYRGFVATVFMTILNMVSNFAGIPLAFAYMILLGNTGILVNFGKEFGINALTDFNLYSTGGISLIYIYFQIPLATLLLIPAFHGIRKEWKEACLLLGGDRNCFWWKIGLPILMPSILSTFSVLFANSLAAYATAYALMMNNISLLPIQIAGCFTGEVKIQQGLGGALSVVMMSIMVFMICVTNVLSKKFQRGEKK